MENVRNGVNLDNINRLVEAVKGDHNLANVRFTAKSTWQGGTQCKVDIDRFYAGGNNMAPEGRRFSLVVDEPGVLGGKDEAPNPVEYLAAGLCGCITAGIATNAALFETELEAIEVSVEADCNIMGLLGLDRSVPTNVHTIKYSVNLRGKGDTQALLRSKETIDRKSPVRNTLAGEVKMVTEAAVGA